MEPDLRECSGHDTSPQPATGHSNLALGRSLHYAARNLAAVVVCLKAFHRHTLGK